MAHLVLSALQHVQFRLNSFHTYLVQMITSMRKCVACNDLWPWPIFLTLFSRDIAYFIPRSHQTRSQCVLQNVAERGQAVKLCADGMNVVTTVWSLFTNLMDVLWTQWTGSNGKDIPERRDYSKSWGDHPVPKLDGVTTCLKRDGRSTNGIAVFRTYSLLGTHYNVMQSSISYSRVHADLGRFYYVDPVRMQTQLDHTAIVTTFILIKMFKTK